MKNLKKVFISFSLISLLFQPLSIYALEKSEMIYSNLNYNGEVKSTDINVSLTNLDNGDIIDYTYLENIKNINGREKFSKESDKLIWKSTGKDIFYEGKLNSELPIKVKIKYFLNDKEVNPKKILGESGDVSIKIELENTAYNQNVNLYTPFVSTAVMMLSSDSNSKVSVSNGKVVSTGNQYIITSIAAPGLDKNISLEEFSDVDFDTISINYTTDSFAINDIYIASSPKLLDEIDISKLDKLSNLNTSLNTLQDGMNQVADGANKLSEGTSTLSAGMTQFSSGLKQAYDGSMRLADGVATLNSEVEYYYGVLGLVDRLFNNQETEDDLARLDPDVVAEIQKIRKIINDNQALINEARNVIISLDDTYHTYELDKFSTSEEMVNYFENIGISTEEIIKLIVCKETYENNIKLMNYLENNNYSLLEGVKNLLNTIMEKANQAYTGTNELSTGALELSNGLQYLYENSLLLDSGNKQVADSTKLLSDGIAKINEEGINKLTQYGSKVSDYSLTIKEMLELSNNYPGFSGTDVSSTIFVYKVSK